MVVWFDKGKIHQTILEFIRCIANLEYIFYIFLSSFYSLTKKHDGRYLAIVTADCLKRFGLDQQVIKNYNLQEQIIMSAFIAPWSMHGQC